MVQQGFLLLIGGHETGFYAIEVEEHRLIESDNQQFGVLLNEILPLLRKVVGLCASGVQAASGAMVEHKRCGEGALFVEDMVRWKHVQFLVGAVYDDRVA